MTFVSVFMAIILVTSAQEGTEKSWNPVIPQVEIRENAAVQDSAEVLKSEGKRRHDRDSDSRFNSLGHTRSLAEVAVLLDGSEVHLIKVDRYAARIFTSPEAVRQAIQMIWHSKVDEPLEVWVWAQVPFWAMDLTMELKNGRTAKLATDGSIFCYENSEGYRWFFQKITPRKI